MNKALFMLNTLQQTLATLNRYDFDWLITEARLQGMEEEEEDGVEPAPAKAAMKGNSFGRLVSTRNYSEGYSHKAPKSRSSTASTKKGKRKAVSKPAKKEIKV